jgi:hypothetical protein
VRGRGKIGNTVSEEQRKIGNTVSEEQREDRE